MMSPVIRQEMNVFFQAFLHGIALTLFYDIFRAIRRTVRHSIIAISVEDFLYWIMAGFLTFCLLFSWTEGVFRGYVAVGIAAGYLFYHNLLSARLLKGMTCLLRFLLLMIQKICKIPKKIIEIPQRKDYNVNEGCKKLSK